MNSLCSDYFGNHSHPMTTCNLEIANVIFNSSILNQTSPNHKQIINVSHYLSFYR